MPTSKQFAREVEALAMTVTGYQSGKSGQSGLCDCIGLVMGAMSRLGHGSYPMHSTNYFARYEMDELRVLKSGETLQVGQLLYKANDDESDLNERYKPSGRYYRENDLHNYYHVGVITSLNPLEITHCTQSRSINGIRRDGSAKGWTHVGELNGVDYDVPALKQEEIMKTAYVSVPEGTSTVNLRKRPDSSAPLIKRINKGVVLDVLEQADGWAKVVDPTGAVGYIMSEFLKLLEYANEGGKPATETADSMPFEENIINRLERQEMLLNAILEAVGR